MYKYFIRPVLFLLSPELVHKIIVTILKYCFFIPGIRKILSLFFIVDNEDLKTEFVGIVFQNPVGMAAGFDKKASSFNDFAVFGFSFIEIGTVTPLPQPGNPKPRLFRLPDDKALINRMGFNSIGVKQVIENLRRNNKKVIIGGNIGKNTFTPNKNALEDYVTCFKELYYHVDYFVVNVSCPNISNLAELQDDESLYHILSELVEIRSKQQKYIPILLKISPDLSFDQIDKILLVYDKTGIDGIVATNTSIMRTGLKTDKEIIDGIGRGGLSGKPITNRSTEVIRYISQKSGNKIPIMGVGGIMNAEDAIEKLNAGAKLIQLYTGFIYEGPAIVKRINKAILKSKRK